MGQGKKEKIIIKSSCVLGYLFANPDILTVSVEDFVNKTAEWQNKASAFGFDIEFRDSITLAISKHPNFFRQDMYCKIWRNKLPIDYKKRFVEQIPRKLLDVVN